MATFQMIIIVVLFLIAGGIGLKLSLQCAQYLTKRPVSINKIFDGLRPKLWMTGGLGLFFISFYAVIVLLGTNLITPEIRIKIFNSIRNNPVIFIYLGLGLFVTISLGTLIVRSIIKRIYNSRG